MLEKGYEQHRDSQPTQAQCLLFRHEREDTVSADVASTTACATHPRSKVAQLSNSAAKAPNSIDNTTTAADTAHPTIAQLSNSAATAPSAAAAMTAGRRAERLLSSTRAPAAYETATTQADKIRCETAAATNTAAATVTSFETAICLGEGTVHFEAQATTLQR